MPKLKTHSGTKDRVKVSKNGKVRVGHSNMNHFLGKKSGSRKRSLRGLSTRSGAMARNIKKNLGV
ncbi:MAG TPA: 50S ribosomal protein L35 [Candidatus Dormibacteraeota bacterium]|jgi:large subunit ribosomal protein L35|nr:50S ribosomal protein L35 [Candidatus Dormibacteraeota bacterium]